MQTEGRKLKDECQQKIKCVTSFDSPWFDRYMRTQTYKHGYPPHKYKITKAHINTKKQEKKYFQKRLQIYTKIHIKITHRTNSETSKN